MKELSINGVAPGAATLERQGFLKRIFGCWHQRLSRPVTIDRVTYCYCKDCGLRQRYDIETGRARGAFYSERPGDTATYFV